MINLGTNRWAFKPELAVSQPIGERWLLDAYAGLWLFTANNAFCPGASVRTQSPVGAFQAHPRFGNRRTMEFVDERPLLSTGSPAVRSIRPQSR